MKWICKQGIALLMVLVMLVGFLPAVTIQTDAASYIYNWGTRGVVAKELSDTAEDWYAKYNVTLDSLMGYSGASSTSAVPSSALYSKLKSLMTGAHSYINDYKENNTLLRYTDCQGGGGVISSFYSGKSIGPSWDGTWNKEHTWPNSKGLGGSDEDDVMMIRPTSTAENSSRGNTAYGESGSYYDPNDESGGKYDLHGDCARIVLYVYVRWGNTSRMWGSNGVMESKDVLLKWMEEDPVDTWELGRNDAVQSITGTRNVFVDYPELAFALFNEEVPAGYQSPSGSSPSYTITAVPNNASYGTVSMSGKTITAYPYTGYQVSGYQVTSGTASVSRSGNTFTVTASSNCTIQILFAPRTQVTLNYIDRGKTVSTQKVYTGDSVVLPAYTGTVPNDYIFIGWVEQQIADTAAKPIVYGAGTSYKPTGGKTFYALYGKVEEGSVGETAYRLVTNTNQLSEGASVVIAASGTTALAMKTTGGANNRYAGQITKNSDGTITFTENVPIDVLTLGAGVNSGTFSFYSEANSQYLAAGTSSDDILKLQNSVDACASFTITVASDGTATIISQTSGTKNSLRYNSGANNFSCYSTGQKAVSLYVASGGGISYYTTNPVDCEHADTENVAALAATCTESGYTAGVYCNDCETYISGHEEIEALGHYYDYGRVTKPAGCETTGTKIYTCENCGDTDTETIAATGHSYDSGKITKPAGCETTGTKTYTCGNCGGTKTETVAATGHNYILSGAIYTCTGCGDSYDTWFISFYVPTGVAAVERIEYKEGGIKLPSAGVPTGEHTYTFVGWTTEAVEDTEEAPAIYQPGETFTATKNTQLYAVYTYAVGGSGIGEYVLTNLSEIGASDSVVITMTTNTGVTYALTSANGTSDAPDAIKVTVSGEKLTAEPAAELVWNIGGSAGNYIFYPAGQTATWLYCTGTNNGVRVGNNSAKTFKIDASSGYLKHNGTNRYVGVYTGNPDWRCYTSTSVNIGNQTLGFYVKGEVGTVYYTTVDGGECKHTEEIAVVTPPTLTEMGYTTLFCAACMEELGVEDQVNALTQMAWGMTLEDELTAKFQIQVDETILETLYIDVTFNGQTERYTAAEELTVSLEIAAAQMTDEIRIELINGEETATKTYTVKQYADAILGDEEQSRYHALVRAMLNYGGAAQVYFDYNVENPAGTEYGDKEVPTEAAGMQVTDNIDSISFYGASLVYREKIAVRFYFTGSTEGIAFGDYDVVSKDGLNYVEIGDILPQNLHQSITLEIADVNGNDLCVTYSPLNYIVRMNAKGSAKLQNLMQALYNYHAAAKDFVTA